MLKNKDGQLSMYALNCGYIQDVWKNDIKVELYIEDCVHVRGYDYNLYTSMFWYTFDSLTEARKAFFKCTNTTFNMTKKETLKSLQSIIIGEE